MIGVIFDDLKYNVAPKLQICDSKKRWKNVEKKRKENGFFSSRKSSKTTVFFHGKETEKKRFFT